ncbi:protein of unknown function [Burkholderia multivorans]
MSVNPPAFDAVTLAILGAERRIAGRRPVPAARVSQRSFSGELRRQSYVMPVIPG